MHRRGCCIFLWSSLFLAFQTGQAFLSPLQFLSRRNTCRNFWLSHNSNENEELDLFDYFDPLLSPHAYPEGIKPGLKPETEHWKKPRKEVSNKFGIDYMSRRQGDDSQQQPCEESSPRELDKDVPDLFDYFDPLLSPHAYPNGISPPREVEESCPEDRYDPLRLDVAASYRRKETPSRKGISKVGILLMDHGSRNPDSNSRLDRLAELYQLQYGSADGYEVFVEPAHMEIAKPSIPDGLSALLEKEVDEIICHPYFLSPGRHVQEDIPQLVSKAIEDLAITIPVVTTDPVGSKTAIMIETIHSLVRENSQVLRPKQRDEL